MFFHGMIFFPVGVRRGLWNGLIVNHLREVAVALICLWITMCVTSTGQPSGPEGFRVLHFDLIVEKNVIMLVYKDI
jgi:hypothetical protein